MSFRPLYAVSIFVSAFLLFQVQPIVARMILPWFGGSSAVWSTCMLFFQTILLLGYLYAHLLNTRTRGRGTVWIHTGLMAVSLLALPLLPNPAWKPTGGENPALRILALLAVTVGAPYFMLSSTSPLLQAWYARREGTVPYRLFSLSNVASLAALLSYPVLVEPNLPVRLQGQLWSAGYVCFAILCCWVAWMSASPTSATAAHQTAGGAAHEADATGAGERFLWFALAACASILLLAVTNFLTQDVAAVPFLWILPLSVYLISFIISFESAAWYRRAFFLPLLALALAFFGYALRPVRTMPEMPVTIGLGALGLFACCMVCHGELARRKPAPRHLTGFYVIVSLGGAAGGLFVGLLAPNLFNAYYEFPIGLGACALLAAMMLPVRGGIARGVIYAAVTAYAVYLGWISVQNVHGYLAVRRNFYGQLRVQELGRPGDPDFQRKLLHGRINHGVQMEDPRYRRTPVAYFCAKSGIGQAMRLHPEGTEWRVGILGLGAGALAAYGRPGDDFRIYEINPQAVELAKSEFTYLSDTPAKVDVLLGDGRLSLENEPDQRFDMLVMDAFSGDSVPVHLVTEEAFTTYFRHLKPGGLLAVNITNRYLDLEPVMERAASHFGKTGLGFYFEPDDDEDICYASHWVVMTDRKPLPAELSAGQPLAGRPGFRMWTDDFSNMFGILK